MQPCLNCPPLAAHLINYLTHLGFFTAQPQPEYQFTDAIQLMVSHCTTYTSSGPIPDLSLTFVVVPILQCHEKVQVLGDRVSAAVSLSELYWIRDGYYCCFPDLGSLPVLQSWITQAHGLYSPFLPILIKLSSEPTCVECADLARRLLTEDLPDVSQTEDSVKLHTAHRTTSFGKTDLLRIRDGDGYFDDAVLAMLRALLSTPKEIASPTSVAET